MQLLTALHILSVDIVIKKMSQKYNFIPYASPRFDEDEMLVRSREFYAYMNRRRSVRDFSDRPVPLEVLENIIRTASTAPSGAHKQPWTFCLIQDPVVKKQIRAAAEKEEYESYNKRMPDEWLADLRPLGTDWNKPFLETAPWIVVCFKRSYEMIDGEKRKNYYVNESVGLACGLFLAAVHNAGLVSLTHTPSPMDFLTKILDRPANERPFLLMPVGYPALDAEVPELTRKDLDDVIRVY